MEDTAAPALSLHLGMTDRHNFIPPETSEFPRKARRIIVVSPRPLFREGLRELVADVPGLQLSAAVASVAEVTTLARREVPDVVIVDDGEREGEGRQALADLLALRVAQIVAVTLEERGMTVYSRRWLPEASWHTLLDLLREG